MAEGVAEGAPPEVLGVTVATLRRSRRCATVEFRAVYLSPQLRRRQLARTRTLTCTVTPWPSPEPLALTVTLALAPTPAGSSPARWCTSRCARRESNASATAAPAASGRCGRRRSSTLCRLGEQRGGEGRRWGGEGRRGQEREERGSERERERGRTQTRTRARACTQRGTDTGTRTLGEHAHHAHARVTATTLDAFRRGWCCRTACRPPRASGRESASSSAPRSIRRRPRWQCSVQ